VEAAQAKIDARQWKEALELLLPWERIERNEDRELVAAKLKQIGKGLVEAAEAATALHALKAELGLRRLVHGEADHADVATSLDWVAGCLHSLGRAGEALPLYEQALEMTKRLYDGSDHPHVARSLNSMAYCLESLGRPGDALPQYAEALAMRKRIGSSGSCVGRSRVPGAVR
jgi:tetratricopeptide (TPR) repeat protein